MSWKRKVRPATDRVAKYSGILRACERRMRSQLTVLMYHRVLEDADCEGYPFPSLVMPRSLFEAQLDYLQRQAQVLTLSSALRKLEDSAFGSKPIVCLTFDDGYADNYEIVAPLLEERGLRGTFFITAGAVEARAPLWYDRAADLFAQLGARKVRELAVKVDGAGLPSLGSQQPWIEWLKGVPHQRRQALLATLGDAAANDLSCPLMTPDQVTALAQRGHEIGSHTLWHPILTTMTKDERQAELEGARRSLRQWTGSEVTGFCYPNGDFDDAVADDLRRVGHTYACTTRPGRNDARTDRFSLRRIDVTPDRVRSAGGGFDPLGFRAEICLFREGLRRGARPRGGLSA